MGRQMRSPHALGWTLLAPPGNPAHAPTRVCNREQLCIVGYLDFRPSLA